MSTIKVEVAPISDIRPHPNADKLELATVQGWQVAVQKGAYQVDQPVVYFEQGTVIPQEMADQLGVTGYLQKKIDIDGNQVLVVNRIKLRGEPSFGLTIPGGDYQVGQDVAELFGAIKYRPPVKSFNGTGKSLGFGEPETPLFPKYTDLENIRSYHSILTEGEMVVATEKIHGTNSRVGYYIDSNGDVVWCAGSRQVRRKDPGQSEWKDNLYWIPLTIPEVMDMFTDFILSGIKQAAIYGELFGKGVQKYEYGQQSVGYRVFDLMIDGRYIDYDSGVDGSFLYLTAFYGIETAPTVYFGGLDMAQLKGVTDGVSLIGGDHGREGIVVRPVKERFHPKIGRVILKYVGDQYLFGKAAEQDSTDL